VADPPPARAFTFDFNGTLSHDEPILCEIFCELFAEEGRPLSAQEYFDRLAGLSDPEIVWTWLGRDHPRLDHVIAERVARYRAAASDGSTVPHAVREAVRYAAAAVPVVVVTGAARSEVEPVLDAAGLAGSITAIVSSDDVREGKPHPESYRRALELLDGDLRPDEVVAFEDTEAGIASAKAARLRCLAVLGTLAPERLEAADKVVPAIDVPLVRRLLAGDGQT
jgi:HAD superfamily hydrolase (TIGR01509 family)